MQINDGSGWKRLPVLHGPEKLEDREMVFDAVWDQTMPGFAAAYRLSDARGHALFRISDDEPGTPYWVEVGMPCLVPERMMTAQLIISPADLSEQEK